MAFLRGGAWGKATARARRVVVDLVLTFPLPSQVTVLVLALVAVLVGVLVGVLVALDCFTVDPLFPLVCVAFERCAGNREMDKEIRQRIRVRGHSRN